MESIDFLPERIKLQRAWRKRLIRRGYLVLICAGTLVVLGYARQGRISTARSLLCDKCTVKCLSRRPAGRRGLRE